MAISALELKDKLRDLDYKVSVRTGTGSMRGLLLVFFDDKHHITTKSNYYPSLQAIGLQVMHVNYCILENK